MSKGFNLDIPRWGKAPSIWLFIGGSIIAGFAFGVGNHLAELVLKGSLRKLIKETDLVPDEIGEQIIPQYDKLYNLDPATGKPYVR
jgi:hypothetical protein